MTKSNEASTVKRNIGVTRDAGVSWEAYLPGARGVALVQLTVQS